MSPAFVGDLTALFKSADRREYTTEQLHGAILQICDQHAVPVGADRVAAAESLAAMLEKMPHIPGYSIQIISTHDRETVAAGIRALGIVA